MLRCPQQCSLNVLLTLSLSVLQEVQQPLPKQPPKQPSTVSWDLSGVMSCLLLIPTLGCSRVRAESQQCLGSLGSG